MARTIVAGVVSGLIVAAIMRAVAQPADVLNQNLANGVIDAIMIGASAINSFKLHEPGNYVTTWFPSSASALMLVIVSLIAFLVHIFSLGYMNDEGETEARRPR